jgi:hypothetical protein
MDGDQPLVVNIRRLIRNHVGDGVPPAGTQKMRRNEHAAQRAHSGIV